MPPSSPESSDSNASVQDAGRMQPVRRSVKFDQTIEFSDKAVARLAPEEEDEKDARIRARELRHRLRREWSSSDIDPSQQPPKSSPAPPVRKRSVGFEARSKSRAPACPQRKRSIGLTTEDVPMPHRSS